MLRQRYHQLSQSLAALICVAGSQALKPLIRHPERTLTLGPPDVKGTLNTSISCITVDTIRRSQHHVAVTANKRERGGDGAEIASGYHDPAPVTSTRLAADHYAFEPSLAVDIIASRERLESSSAIALSLAPQPKGKPSICSSMSLASDVESHRYRKDA